LNRLYFFFGLTLLLLFSCREPVRAPNISVVKTNKKQVKSFQKKTEKKPAWVELKSLDSSFVYDIRYATSHNFVHRKMYPCGKCFVRPVVAQALLKIQKELKLKGWRLKLFDCYRPGKVQQALWHIRPDPRYVADPKKGSMHNRGVAVDLTIVDQNGKELDMGTPFDYFGKKAYHAYKHLKDTVLKNRIFLKNLMMKYDMQPITSEWWHYSYRLKEFPIENWVWRCP